MRLNAKYWLDVVLKLFFCVNKKTMFVPHVPIVLVALTKKSFLAYRIRRFLCPCELIGHGWCLRAYKAMSHGYCVAVIFEG